MENTLENKAKFFAQYYGQRVVTNKYRISNKIENRFLEGFNHLYITGWFLQLKPLSAISDEDAVILAQILTRWKWNLDFGTKVIKEGNQITVYYDAVSNGFKHKTVIYDDFFSINYSCEPCRELTGDAYDYLRSKGYLVPFNGLPCEELINRGWAVLEQEVTNG